MSNPIDYWYQKYMALKKDKEDMYLRGVRDMREQMMKNALNGEIMTSGFYPYEQRVVAPFPSCPYEFGTEVKVIVIKED